MKHKRIKLSKSERAAIAAAERALAKEHTARAKQHAETAAFTARRRRVADAFKQRLFDKAMAAAGIDLEAIAQRQKRDQASILAFASKRRAQAQRLASPAHDRHMQESVRRAKAWGERDLVGPATVIVLIDKASSIACDSSLSSSVSIDSHKNIARVRATAVNDSGFLGNFGALFVNWSFVWTPPRNGLLNVVSFLSMVGVSWLVVDSGCFGGHAFSSITTGIRVTQGGTENNSPNANLLVRTLNVGGGAPSLGEVDLLELDEINPVTMSQQIPVSANSPLVVTVWGRLWVGQTRGQAELDFHTGNFRLNVPFVQMVLL